VDLGLGWFFIIDLNAACFYDFIKEFIIIILYFSNMQEKVSKL